MLLKKLWNLFTTHPILKPVFYHSIRNTSFSLGVLLWCNHLIIFKRINLKGPGSIKVNQQLITFQNKYQAQVGSLVNLTTYLRKK